MSEISKAALSKRGVPARVITDGDLIISITPPTTVQWYGTRAHLEAEGIIPEGAEWEPTICQRWEDSLYRYLLLRSTPNGMRKLPRAERLKIDWWQFERRDRRYERQGCWPEYIYENKKEYEELLLGLDACLGKRKGLWEARQKAECDKAFQRFTRRTLAPDPCAVITQPTVADTKARQDAIVARLRRESRRVKDGGDAGAPA